MASEASFISAMAVYLMSALWNALYLTVFVTVDWLLIKVLVSGRGPRRFRVRWMSIWKAANVQAGVWDLHSEAGSNPNEDGCPSGGRNFRKVPTILTVGLTSFIVWNQAFLILSTFETSKWYTWIVQGLLLFLHLLLVVLRRYKFKAPEC
jgi:hypothetical protein